MQALAVTCLKKLQGLWRQHSTKLLLAGIFAIHLLQCSTLARLDHRMEQVVSSADEAVSKAGEAATKAHAAAESSENADKNIQSICDRIDVYCPF